MAVGNLDIHQFQPKIKIWSQAEKHTFAMEESDFQTLQSYGQILSPLVGLPDICDSQCDATWSMILTLAKTCNLNFIKPLVLTPRLQRLLEAKEQVKHQHMKGIKQYKTL